jgi:endonuclease/exonuclease/phosphatase family metal-dependent hydrolase
VIIARTDLPSSRLKVSNPESHNFTATLVIPSAIPGPSFRVPRGWSAVEVKVRGKTVRFVNTHLEAFSVAVRNQQARELTTALAGSAPPVVLAGDLNSAPDDSAGAYGTFAAAGMWMPGWWCTARRAASPPARASCWTTFPPS